MLAGDSMVENSPPTVGTSLYHVVVNSDAAPRLLDLKHVFVDPDVNDEISISIFSNTNATIVTPYLQGEELLLEFSGVLGNSIITLRGTDSQGESVLSGFHVNVLDGGSSISATVSDVSSIKPVGTVEAELSPPDVLNAWEPAALEVWYTVGEDTPSEPFDFGVRFQGLASHFEPPTSHASLGAHMSIQHYEIDQWHSTYASILDLDLSSYQIGDKVLIASFVYAPATKASGSLFNQQEGEIPALSHEALFQVTQAVFIGTKLGVYEPYVASQIAPVVFDSNNDGRVGLADFAQFVSRFGKSSDAFSPYHDATASWFDFNRDGKVGLADFSLFVGNFGKQRGIHNEFAMPGLTDPLYDSDSVEASDNSELPINYAVDYVFDPTHRVLYAVSIGGHLERWDYESQTLLGRYANVATSPSSVEIVPGGQFVLVGEAQGDNGQGVVWVVDVTTGLKTRLTFDLDSNEAGVQDVAISADGTIFVTSEGIYAAGNQIRTIDFQTAQVTKLMSLPDWSQVARTADHSLIVFQGGNVYGGDIIKYHASVGAFSYTPSEYDYFDASRSAVSPRDGKMFVRNTLLSEDWQRERIGPNFLFAPIFDNQRPLLYGVLPESDEVLMLDVNTLEVLRRIDIGGEVNDDVKMALSDDSKHLFVMTTSGIRQIATTLPGTDPDDIQAPSAQVLPGVTEGNPPWITIRFSEPVTGLTLNDLTLRRDRGSNLLTGQERLFSIDGGRTWILLGAQQLMASTGSYALHLSSAESGISDGGGNQLVSDVYQVWNNSPDSAGDVPLPLVGVLDQVYDEATGVLYITTEDGTLHRWNVAEQKLLPSIVNVAAIPAGLDTSPDGRYIYIGEGLIGINMGLVYKIDLETGLKTTFQFDNGFSNNAVHDLAVSADGRVMFTLFFAGSGYTDVGVIDGSVLTLMPQYRMYTDSIITREPDRSVVYFFGSDKASVASLIYDVDQGVFIENTNNLTWPGAPAYEIADPKGSIYYVVDFDTDEIVTYDQHTNELITSLAIGEDAVRDTYESEFQLVINADANLIYMLNDHQVRQIAIPPTLIDQQRYAIAVDDLFDQLEESELELLLD